MTPLDALNKAVKTIGGQTAFAAVCGDDIKQGHVWNWLNRDKKLPPQHALKVERACLKKGVEVYAHQLCPDVFEDTRAKPKRKPKTEAA